MESLGGKALADAKIYGSCLMLFGFSALSRGDINVFVAGFFMFDGIGGLRYYIFFSMS